MRRIHARTAIDQPKLLDPPDTRAGNTSHIAIRGGLACPHCTTCSPLYRSPIEPTEDGPYPLVLAALVSGGSYVSSGESRRKNRYAVLSALHAAGYLPTDELHLHYWRTNAFGHGSEPVPYEWFEKQSVRDPQAAANSGDLAARGKL
jgi:hypothetical protein